MIDVASIDHEYRTSSWHKYWNWDNVHFYYIRQQRRRFLLPFSLIQVQNNLRSWRWIGNKLSGSRENKQPWLTGLRRLTFTKRNRVWHPLASCESLVRHEGHLVRAFNSSTDWLAHGTLNANTNNNNIQPKLLQCTKTSYFTHKTSMSQLIQVCLCGYV